MFLTNLFKYTNSTEDKTNLVIDVELPGVDPKTVKVGFYRDQIQLNGQLVTRVTDRFDLTKATAELKFGLLKIVVPENTEGKGEIPLTIT